MLSVRYIADSWGWTIRPLSRGIAAWRKRMKFGHWLGIFVVALLAIYVSNKVQVVKAIVG